MPGRKKKSKKGQSIQKSSSSPNNATGSTNQNLSNLPPAVASAIARRAEKRATRAAERTEECDAQKEFGNELFQAGDYDGAVAVYESAMAEFGEKPTLLSNLVLGYLKLEAFEDAEGTATIALQRDPRMLKARYRRGLARKALLNLVGAEADFSSVVQQDPACAEAVEQLRITRELRRELEGSDQNFGSGSENSFRETVDWPAFDSSPLPSDQSDAESDTSDCQHTGSGVPCRFYNHDGCLKKDMCRYSHAPDDNSVRDQIGKNVCLFFLMNQCKFGAGRCAYSHDKTYLSPRWRDAVETKMFLHATRRNLDRYVIEGFSGLSMSNSFAGDERGNYSGPDIPIPPTEAITVTAGAQIVTQPSKTGRFLSLVVLDSDPSEPYKRRTIKALEDEFSVKIADSRYEAMAHLRSSDLSCVFVADAALFQPENSWLVQQLVKYTRKGGCVVMGGAFGTFAPLGKMAKFFSAAWGVDWSSGDYSREVFLLNQAHVLVNSSSTLADSYSMKALCIKGIEPLHAIYTHPSHGSSQSPAVQVRVGEGYMGYIGDVNWEDSSITLLLAMLRPSISESPRQPFIIICSFGNEDMLSNTQADLLDTLHSKLEVLRGLSNPRVVDLLVSQDLVGVLVTDQALVEAGNAYLLQKLVDFVKPGGTVVLGGSFAACSRFDKLGPFFQDSWGLPWACGDYTTSDATVNPKNELVKKGLSISPICHTKALHLGKVAPDMAVYLPDKGTRLYTSGTQQLGQTPVAYARVGKGHLGYIGDVGLQDEHTKITLAMFGLSK